MDFETFIAAPRWKVLEIISKTPASPIEIADKLQTSVAYISQQLKLLEAANLIKKDKTGASEKGKPRMLFSNSGSFAHVALLTNDLAEKRLIELDTHREALLKIWLVKGIENNSFENAYLNFEKDLDEIDSIVISQTGKEFLIVSDSKKVKTKFESISKEFSGKISLKLISQSNLQNHLPENPIFLYQTHSTSETKLKGGKKE